MPAALVIDFPFVRFGRKIQSRVIKLFSNWSSIFLTIIIMLLVGVFDPLFDFRKYILRVFKGVMSMKVILQSEVENLGKNGDVLVVADGYGRNYLLPKG